jgi:DivIVA domain-containing protein
MPLTPEDVSNKRFTPVRLREGYDMGEVDQFLDEVESELERLHQENDDLRAKLAAAQGGEAPAAAVTPEKPADKPAEDAEATAEEKPESRAEEPAARPDVARPAAVEQIHVTTAAEASSAATRLLELATRNADEVEAHAKAEAEKILSDARAKAERLESETKSKTDRLEQDARTRSQMLDSETEAKRRELFGDLEKEKSRLDGEVENLRTFEREYRSRLKSYFTQQLEALEGNNDASAGESGRLQTILGEEEGGDDRPQEHQGQQD